jgi:WD40 repeat protein
MNDSKVRIFVSSPADVERERAMVKDILDRLAGEFLPYFRVEPVLWEEEALTADRTFQAGMVKPSDCDIVLVVLWTRLGSPLPQDPYQGRTGTEWEFFDAVDATAEDGRPEVLVYKKTNPKLVDITNPQQTLQAVEDRKRLEEFFLRNFFNEDQTFRRAFRTFDSDAVFRNLVEVQLRKLLNRRIFVERRGPGRAFEWSGSPFRPRGPFDFGDERVFTGRESETRELVSRLHEQTSSGDGFLLISGSSGSGKTSLVRAGLLPRLVRPHQVPGVAGCRWCLVDLSIQPDPLEVLAQALCAPDVLGERLEDQGVDAKVLRRSLEVEPGLAVSQVRGALEGLSRAYRDDTGERDASLRLAVVVDPLDAVLDQTRDVGGGHEAFFSTLASLALSGSVWVVALVRSDRLPDLGRAGPLAELCRGNCWFRLDPIPAARSRQVMEIPALVAGLSYGSESGPKLPELLEAQTAGLRLWAPLLQGTLDRLFQSQLTGTPGGAEPAETQAPGTDGAAGQPALLQPNARSLRALGGLSGDALRRAEDVWDRSDDDARAALPRLCRALIDLESVGVREPVPRTADLDLLESDLASASLVRALVEARVLVTDGEPDPILLTPCEPAGEDSLRAWFGRAVRETRSGWGAGAAESAGDDGAGSHAAPSEESGPEQVSRSPNWQDYRRTVTLAHPDLIRTWAPVADWLRLPENREALVLRGQITRQARLWKRTDCNREYLLGEKGYAAAKRFEDLHGNELEPAEQELLERSRLHRRSLRRGRFLVRATGLVLVSLLVLVTLAAQWAWDASRTATANLHRSQLEAADLAIGRGNTPDAVVLALDAAPYLPRRSANALSRALTGSHLVAMAHEGPPFPGLPLSAAVDAAGERLLTADLAVGLRAWRLSGTAFEPERDALGAELGIHSVLFAGDRVSGGFLGISPVGVWRLPLGKQTEPDYPCGAELGGLFDLDPGGRKLALSHALSAEIDAVCLLDLRRPGQAVFDGPVHEGQVRSLAFSPEGTRLLTAGSDGRLKVLGSGDGRVLRSLPLDAPLRPAINRAVFDPRGERILVAGSDGRLRVYGRDGRLIRKFRETENGGAPRRVHNAEVHDLAFSPDGESVVAVDDDGQVVRWDLDPDLARKPTAFVLGHHEDAAELVRVSPRGSLVLTASADRTARLWDLGTGRQLAVFSHDGKVSQASFTADGHRILTLSAGDGSARLWSRKPVSRLGQVLPHDDHVRHLAFSAPYRSGSSRLATASSSGQVRVWDLGSDGLADTAAQPLMLTGHAAGVRRVDFSADGERLVSAGRDGTARVWDLVPGDTTDRLQCLLRVSDAATVQISHALFDPSDRPRWLLTASNQPEAPLRLWDPETCSPISPEIVASVAGAGVGAAAVRRLADGVLVALGSDDGRVRILFGSDTGEWTSKCDLEQHSRPVSDLDISPDGLLVASASEDRWGRVLPVSSCAVRASSADLVGHSDAVRSVRFSADGQRLVTASLDGTARVWSAAGDLISVLVDDQNRVYHAEFGADDAFVLTASRDGAVRVWLNPDEGAPQTGRADLVYEADFGGVPYAAFSPDGRSIAAGYWRNAAVLWRLLDTEEVTGGFGQEARGAARGKALRGLALIREAWRFRRDNRLDELRGAAGGE